MDHPAPTPAPSPVPAVVGRPSPQPGDLTINRERTGALTTDTGSRQDALEALRTYVASGLELQLRLEAVGDATGAEMLKRHLSEAAAHFDALHANDRRALVEGRS